MTHETTPSSATVPLDGSAPIQDDEGQAPAQVGRFRILDTIGVGGMGRVYSAHDPTLDRTVAIKLLRRRGSLEKAAVARARLLREARAMAQIRHDNVVTVFDVGLHDDDVFLAMERVDGRDLRVWLREAPRSVPEILTAFVQAGRGLAAAHAGGVVHRDFKPTNVMVEHGGTVKVLDFGLAREIAGDDDVSLHLESMSLDGTAPAGSSLVADLPDPSQDGLVVGTPKYMAPEQHLGEEATAASDQYAFCVAVWEALAGRAPFVADEYKRLVAAKLKGRVSPPPASSRLPARIGQILARGMSTRAADRWPSMAMLCDVLEAVPRARRRRRAAAVLGTGVAMAIGLAATIAPTQPQPCSDGATRLREVWATARTEAIADLAARAGEPAPLAWARTHGRLETFAASWQESYDEICGAITRDGSAAVDDPRIDCLHRRLDELDAALRVLEDADVRAWQSADTIAMAIAPPETCADPVAEGFDGPADPRVATEVEDLRRKLDWAAARMNGGDLVGARTIALDAAARADALGFRPLVAEAYARLGRIRMQADEDAEAAEDLQNAYFIAKDVRHTEVEIVTSSLLVSLTAELGADQATTEGWTRHAEAALERAGWPAREHARLLTSVASMQQHQGRVPEAIETLRRAAAIAEDGAAGDTALRALIANNLGYMLYEQGHYEDALELHLKVLAERRAELGDHPYVVSSLNNVGFVLDAQDRQEDALDYHREALERALRIYGEEHTVVADTLNSIALLHFSRGELAEAKEMLERVLQIARAREGEDGTIVAQAHANLGLVVNDLGDSDAALDHYAQAIAIYERAHGPGFPRIASVLHNTANIHLARGDIGRAIPIFREAIEMREAANGRGDAKLAFPLTGLGIALLSDDRAVEAEPVLERALSLRLERGVTGGDLALTRRHLARALWDIGLDRPRAIELAHEAEAGYRDAGDETAAEEVARWIAEHPPAEAGDPPPGSP
jgi:tetratricopeptide (TPR) repeat protein/tRNA A-37 threonylcarbamoyl transferase component Bud32